MNAEIVAHAARVLGREAGRMMELRMLCDRTCAELGLQVASARLLRIIEAHPERFAVLKAGDGLIDGWLSDEIDAYGPALARAGIVAGPIVLLTGPAEDELFLTGLEPARATGAGAEASFDLLLEDVHSGVTELLRVERGDADPLRVAQAVAGLAALRPRRRRS